MHTKSLQKASFPHHEKMRHWLRYLVSRHRCTISPTYPDEPIRPRIHELPDHARDRHQLYHGHPRTDPGRTPRPPTRYRQISRRWTTRTPDTKITLDINDLPVADEFRVQEWIHGQDTNCEAIEIRIVEKDQSEIVSTNATPSIRSRVSTPREPPKPHVQQTKAETPSQDNPEVHIAQPKKELIITLGKDQVTQPVGPVGKTSMIHVRMWTRYMLWLKTKGKKHNAYAKFSKTPPKPGDEKMITLQGRTYLCYGPFIADINLDGIDMKVPLMITTDT